MRKSLPLLMLSVCWSLPAFAQPQATATTPAAPVEQVAPQTLEEKKALNEGLGLYTSPQQGALGPALWQGVPRAELYSMIDAINPLIHSPALRDFVLRILLTDIDPQSLEGSGEGANLLTRRMAKLNQMGAFEKVADLYENAADQKLPADLAQAGLTGLIGANRTSVACLESKVHSEITSTEPFWLELAQLCKGIVGKVTDTPSALVKSVFTDAAFRFKPINWDALEKLSVIERGALISQNKLDYTALMLIKPTLQTIDAQMQIFNDPALPPTLKIELATALAKTGLVNTAQLHALYTDLGRPLALSGKAAIAPWEKLVSNYVRLVPPTARPNEAAIESPIGPAYDSLLAETLLLKGSFGSQALSPLKSALEKLATPETLTDEAFRTGLAILLATQSEKTANWLVEIPDKITKNPEKSKYYTPLLLSGYILGAPMPPQKLPDSISEEGAKAHPAEYALIALASTFNPADLPFSNVNNIKYDKENLLTWLKNYVMHGVADDDSYAKTLESKHLGKVALAAILALQQKPIGETSPKTLKTVLEGLSSVGLDDIARRILTESLLQREFIEIGASQKSLETETKENPNHGTSRPPSTTEAGSTSEH